MEYPLCLFFTICIVSSTIASEEWVQVPIIGHRPKGSSEKRVSESTRIGTFKTPLSANKALGSAAKASGNAAKASGSAAKAPGSASRTAGNSAKVPFRPSKRPASSAKVNPWSTRSPPTSTHLPSQNFNGPEDPDLPELRIDSGLPVDEFMRAHETLSHYGRGSVVEKVNFLGHLKKQLLQKTAELMPRAIIALSERSPATSAEGRGHKGIGFPSNEGTLMSLCFLVFAVFLVKVVMQLIQGLQNNSLGVVTSAATRTARSDWDRTHTEEELLRLLESLKRHKRAWAQP